MSNRVFKALGGRKSAAGFYASILLTAMAFPLRAEFQAYATSLLFALGLTVGSVAWEDMSKRGSSDPA